MSTRKTFHGLWKCNPALTKRGWPQNKIDQGILRTALNGTFFTADHMKYLPGDQSQMCPFCSQPDSQMHRHWFCTELEDARKHCDEETKATILSYDPAVYNHGWIPHPESLDEFRKQLHLIRDQTSDFQVPQIIPEHLHFFTDGSCLDPQDQFSRIASWGVMLGTTDLACDFFPLASGLVPGLIQTSARAELTAAIAAVKFVARFPRPFTLWIDNDFVVQAIRRFLDPQCLPPQAKVSNHDLLLELFQWIQFLQPLSPEVIKVCSHQDLEKISDPIEAWALRGNEAADELASHVYVGFPHIMQVRQQLQTEIRFLENMKSALHKTIISVGNLALDLIKKQRKGTHVTDIGGDNTVDTRVMQEWLWPSLPTMVQPKFRVTEWSVFVDWSKSLHLPQESVKFWSWIQLVVDFGLQTTMVAPWYCRSSKRWKISTTCPRSSLSKRCRWFKTYVGKIFAQAGLQLPMAVLKPDSFAIHFWCHCLPVAVPDARSRKVDEWLIARRSNFLKSNDLQSVWDVP